MTVVNAISIDELDLIPDLSGGLYVPDFQTLIVADLHLEKGSSFAMRGVPLPPYDTRATLRSLATICTRLRPKKVVSLGDSFHDGTARERLDDTNLDTIRWLTDHHEVIWLAGNHDRIPPDDLGGRVEQSIRLGPITLRHEPTRGLPLEPEIAGHLHPVAAIARRGLRLKARCFASNGQRLVMPAFGSFTGGLNVRDAAFADVFPGEHFIVWMLGKSAVYRFPSRKLLPGRR